MSDKSLDEMPWRCFHCEFVTSDREEAAAHFGDCDESEPLCLTWAKLNADGRAAEYQTQIRERNAVERENTALRTSNEALEYRTHAEEQSIRSYKPFKDCRTINDVFFVYDSMEGRAIAAEERAEAAEAKLAEQWISAKERLPEIQEDVHVWVIYKGHRVGAIAESWREADGTWAMGSAKGFKVTHWRPLPAAPDTKGE